MQPIKNPTVAFTGPYGSRTSATFSKNDSWSAECSSRSLLMRVATSWCRGRVNPCLLAQARSFSIAFPGISISLGQTFQQAWQVVQVKRPSRTASAIRSPLSRGSVRAASPVAWRWAQGTWSRQQQGRQRGSRGTRCSPAGVLSVDIGLFWEHSLVFRDERRRYPEFWQEIGQGLSSRELIGSMALLSSASSMQASTGSPFTRTAQEPHWPEAQE